MKTLVVFYSRTGTTRKVGVELANQLKCEYEEIIDLKDRKGPIGWLTSGRDAMQKKLTDIKDFSRKINSYDLIVIGSPVWGGSVCPAVRTFLEKNKDNIKKTGFFCTMGGDNPSKVFEQMEETINKKPLGILSLKTKEVNDNNHIQKINDFVNLLR